MTASETMVFYSTVDRAEDWRDAMAAAMPDLTFATAADVTDPSAVRYALVWKPPAGFFAPFRNLSLLINLGAGVDSLLGRPDLPDIPVTRLSDPLMSRMMAGYVLFAVLRYARDIPRFERAKRSGLWDYVHPREAADITVGVLGLGELGGLAAAELARQGYSVRGWSRSPKEIPGVECTNEPEGLIRLLSTCEIIVIMLPLTGETQQLLTRERLALLRPDAKVINVSRGAVIDQDALVDALREGRIAEATLDVFATEPLPAGHELWGMENVLITPHLASVALPKSAAAQIAANIRRVRAGLPVTGRIDPRAGY